MAAFIDHDTVEDGARVVCGHCGWAGPYALVALTPGGAGRVLVFTCGYCGRDVIHTTAPTPEETREAAAGGDARAIARVRASAA